MNMLSLLSGVRIAHIACYWKVSHLHCIQVLCQSKHCKADDANPTYRMLQRQLSHLKGFFFNALNWFILLSLTSPRLDANCFVADLEKGRAGSRALCKVQWREEGKFVFDLCDFTVCDSISVLSTTLQWIDEYLYLNVLWHVDPFLGNDSVNTFPRQRIRRQQSDNFRCYAAAL
jgi:hypothetical protein